MKPVLKIYLLSAVAFLAGLGPARAAPPVTAGLVLHLDASAITGLNDGDKVAQWNDLSGCGNHAAQATEARRPTYKPNVINGKPAVRLEGTTGMIVPNSASLSLQQTCAFFVVFKALSTDLQEFFTQYQGRYLSSRDNQLRAYWYSKNPAGWHNSEEAVVVGKYHVGVFRWDVDGIEFLVDGISRGFRASTGNGSHTSHDFGLGYERQTNSRFFLGDFSEILLYNRALPDEERQAVEQYLGRKWLGWASGFFNADFY